jgi:hypothetical protein
MNDSRRRRELLRLLAAGGLGTLGAHISAALASGDRPPRGLHRLQGTATVNDKDARPGTPVRVGDRVATGPRSQAIVVVGTDAFLMRSTTRIEIVGNEGVLSGLTVAAGRVLSVFAHKPVAIRAGNATIGIRGTGAYLEIEPANVYFCLCYGEALVEGPGMAGARHVKTTHHESPLLLSEEGGIMRVDPGPFRNHTDAELVLLESLVGREPPFAKGGQYPAGKY